MTARLIALMSALLFLSLLAFILLVRQSEEAVMEEVGRTVSKVGSETVRAFVRENLRAGTAPEERESLEEGFAFVFAPTEAMAFALRTDFECSATDDFPGLARPVGDPGAGDAAGRGGPTRVAVTALAEASQATLPALEVTSEVGDAGRTRFRVRRPDAEGEVRGDGIREFVWESPDGAPPGPEVLRRGAFFLALADAPGAGFGISPLVLPHTPVQVESNDDGTMRVEIRVMTAESGEPLAGGPGAGPRPGGASPTSPGDDASSTGESVVVFGGLRGPSSPASSDLEGRGDVHTVALRSRRDAAGAGALAPATLVPFERQAVFQMSTRDYGAVFAALRGRMWAWFLAVVLMGTLLSAWLARRFTRPVRDLDLAIRRLAREDLDVEVPVAGGGEVARLSLAFNDMTRRLRIARERSRELTRRERLSALGRLAAGVAHDVRNPLHSINLSLQHLQDTCRPAAGDGPEFDRTVGIIRGEIRRLDGLVSNFLRFARSGPGEQRPVDVDHLLRETGQVVAKEAAVRGVEVEVGARAGTEVLAEGEALRSALLNLVLNSFEAMPGGGTLTLRSRVRGDAILLEVSDTGVGIAEDDREQIFDFGYTTREDGHGLGLAMVHEIVVEEHGGRVEVDSAVGRGTTIRIELPAPAPAEVGA